MKKSKKLIAILLCLVTVLSTSVLAVYADNNNTTPVVVPCKTHGQSCYKFSSISGNTVTYICLSCRKTYTKDVDEVLEKWNYGSTDKELDVSYDKKINAKDYAKLRHYSKYGK